MFSLSLWPAALLTSQRGNSVGHFPFVHFRRGYERGFEREQGQKLRECANTQLLLFQPEMLVIFPLSKIFAWNKEGGKKTPKLVSSLELGSLRKIQLLTAADNPILECKKVVRMFSLQFSPL